MSDTDISHPGNVHDLSHRVNGGGNSIDSFYSGNLSGNSYDGCVRFLNVEIPKGASIAQSYLEFYATCSGYNTWRTSVRGIAEDNTASLSDSNPFTRSQTGSSTSYEYGMYSGLEFYFFINVTSIVQEIVNRGGWGSGNALALTLSNNSSDYGNAISTSNWGNFTLTTSFYPPVTTTTSTTTSTSTSTTTSTSSSTTTTSTSTTTLLDDYGMKISLPGIDVKTASVSNLAYSSKFNTFKVFSQGTTSGTDITIPHNLGYAPTFEVFMESGNNRYRLPRLESPYKSADYVQAFAYSDNTNLRIKSNVSANFYYYIFYEAIPT